MTQTNIGLYRTSMDTILRLSLLSFANLTTNMTAPLRLADYQIPLRITRETVFQKMTSWQENLAVRIEIVKSVAGKLLPARQNRIAKIHLLSPRLLLVKSNRLPIRFIL